MPDNFRWHDLAKHPDDLPDLGERVLVTIGESMVGEAYLKNDMKWYRYCDLEPIESFMRQGVDAWMKMPKPFRKTERKKKTGGTEQK